jgi:hypothetical protein
MICFETDTLMKKYYADPICGAMAFYLFTPSIGIANVDLE